MYKIVYLKLVLTDDFKKIPKDHQSRIVRAIHKKLKKDPYAFGKPLKGDLKGYFRLRIDPYRIIYSIKNNLVIVKIIHIGLRKNFLAYIEAAKRLKLLKTL